VSELRYCDWKGCGFIWWDWERIGCCYREPNKQRHRSLRNKQRRYQLLETLPLRQNTTATTKVQEYWTASRSSPHPWQVKEGNGDRNPEIARAYLALQSQFYHQLPTIHDAWQQDKQVVIIADRCDWPKLMDMWEDDKTTSLQICTGCTT